MNPHDDDAASRPEVTAAARRAEQHLRRLADRLASIDPHTTLEDWLTVRAATGDALAGFAHAMEDIDRILDAGAARSRILTFLRQNLGVAVTKDQLNGVAGISEWARRVRELREDEGWVIHTATTHPSMRPGDYMLASDTPQPQIVRVWAAAKAAARLRTAGGAVDPSQRVLAFLTEIHPLPAAKDQLTHVAGTDPDVCLAQLRRRGHEFLELPDDDLLCPSGVAIVLPDGE